MIGINGRPYAALGEPLNTQPLFTSGTSPVGFYQPQGKGVLLLNLQCEPFAYVANDNGSCFFVSASRQDDGRTRYMFSTTSQDEVTLGLDRLRFIEQREAAAQVIRDVYAVPAFHLGQLVNRIGFVNCFDKWEEPIPNLYVTEIRRIESFYLATYYRIKAEAREGYAHAEGAERFFEPAPALCEVTA